MHRFLSLECKNALRSKSGRDGEGNGSRNSNRLDGECDHALAGSGCVSKVRPFKPFNVSTLLRQACAKPLRSREGLSFHLVKFRSPRLPKLTIFSLTACTASSIKLATRRQNVVLGQVGRAFVAVRLQSCTRACPAR